MQFKNVALIGAGAIGAYFVYGFTGLEDVSFCVVAEGERKSRLEKEGIIINDTVYRPVIKTAEEAKGADLLLVCTKYHGLPGTLDMIETIVDENTTVMSLLNGIDSEEIIAERIGAEHMVYSVMRIQSERRDGKIKFVPETTPGVSVGEKNGEISERVLAFEELMKRAGLRIFVLDNIIWDQWSKYLNNIIYNLPQAVLSVGYGAYFSSEYLAAIQNTMFDEVCAVAAAEGITNLEKADWSKACLKSARFSTLQDLDAKRHTEIDMFYLPLAKLARKHNLQIPFCQFVYYAIKTLEEKNDKKFDY